jgi:signal transduction histidine kinase
LASDTLGQLTDRVVANAQQASVRLAATYRQAYWLIGLAIAIAAVMVAAALVYFSRSISAPLLALADRMHRLAVNDTSVDIPGTERRDEIGEMTRAAGVFRNNAIQLMRSQRMLAEQASVLAEKLAQEQRLTSLQRNFVSMASHEFRTPLNIIDGHAQRLIRTKDRISSDEIAERARKLRGAVLRMTHLIDNLLNSSRLIDGGAEHYFHPTQIDLAEVLHEVAQLHQEMAPGAKIVEKVSLPLQTAGDPKLLFQVFSNLISNAVKYSPEGGPIEVEARLEENEILVAVSDRGIGIPEKDLDRLFERYHRGSNVSGIVGTGLGLYLVKMVVDLHGGSVAVDSREGEGSRFTVRLPVRDVQQREPAAALETLSS